MGNAAGAFLANDAGAKFFADIVPGVNYRNRVASGGQAQCCIIAGWSGAHDDHIVQNCNTSCLLVVSGLNIRYSGEGESIVCGNLIIDRPTPLGRFSPCGTRFVLDTVLP